MKIVLTISLILNLFFGIWFFKTRQPNLPKSPFDKEDFMVSRVIDGDTFVIDNNQEIRLMSVDAPEISLCGGAQSKEKLKELIENKKVRIEGNVNDHFGRLLALVYLDNKLINEEIIRLGWARFTSTASKESERLKKAFLETKDKKIGIFSTLCYQETNIENPKCLIKGNIKDGKKIYFFKGCGNYSNVAIEKDLGDRWFCSEKEATEGGFVKAENCWGKKY